MIRLLLALLSLIALPLAAMAAPGDAMIIVSNKNYRGGIPPVEFADRDAGEIEKAARAANLLGISPTAIKRLDDLTQGEADGWFRADGTPGEELAAFLRRATLGRRDATIYFYYTGHGIAARSELRGADELHLVLNDTRTAAVARSALSIEAVKLALAKAGPPEGRIVMWVDACFSGLGRDGRQLWDGARMVGDVAAAVKPKAPDRVVMLTAAAGNEPAWSDAKRKHGAFTDALLDGLYGGAAGSDGQVTAEALLAFVSRRVNERLARQGRGQTPTLIGKGATPMVALKAPYPERVPGLRRRLELRCATVGASREAAEISAFLEGECHEDCPCHAAMARHLRQVEDEARACAEEAKALEAIPGKGAAARAQLLALRGTVTCAPVRERVAAAIAALEQAEGEAKRKADAEAEARERARQEEIARQQAAEAARRDPDRGVAPGSGQSFKDRLVDGRECAFCPELVVVPAGAFDMGSSTKEIAALIKEHPDGKDWWEKEVLQRKVTIRQPFAVGKFEVTRGQFAAFVKATGHETISDCHFVDAQGKWGQQADKSWQSPGFPQEDSHPVACVSWGDAKAYVAWLAKVTGKGYRLLSEAEWEYTARATTTTRYHFGDSGSDLCTYSNVADQTAKKTFSGWTTAACTDGYTFTAPVGRFKSNAWGIHDMHGNVWEWVEDCWNENYKGASTDGSAWTAGACNSRVFRGGSWFNLPRFLRAAVRLRLEPNSRVNLLGLRVARTISPTP